MQAKLISIGNSKGLRLPKPLVEKYHLGADLDLEERDDGILIRSGVPEEKLTWDQTYRDMAKSDENWDEWEVVAEDGLE